MASSYSPLAYNICTAVAVALGLGLCVWARRHPGRWTVWAARVLGAVLLGEMVSWQLGFLIQGNWSLHQSLPLDLCDMSTLVGCAACWTRRPRLVETLWFWGLAGTLQAIITPDLGAAFPHAGFWDYVVEHDGIVVSAVFLVIGLRLYPRVGSAIRIYGMTVVYAAFVGAVDAATGANYLFLRHVPGTWSLLSVMGPWPWYIVGAAAVAAVLFAVLYLPFVAVRRPRGVEEQQLALPTTGGSGRRH